MSASILPIGKTQFFDNNGEPLAAGTVLFEVPNNPGTLKDTWQDTAQTVLNVNPVVLDSAGRALIYGFGAYQMTVKDSLGNQIFSAVTSDYFLDQNGSQLAFLWCGTATGLSNAFTVSPNPAIAGPTLPSGTPLAFTLNAGSNTDSSTLAITNVTSPIALKKVGANGLENLKGGEIVGGELVFGIYDGTQIVLFGSPKNSQFTNYLGTSSGSANAQIVSPVGLTGLNSGQLFCFTVGAGLQNTDTTTLVFNTSTTFTFKKDTPQGLTPFVGGELVQGMLAICLYDGTNLILVNPATTYRFVNTATTQSPGIGSDKTIYRASSGDLTVDLPLATTVWPGYTLFGIADTHQIILHPNVADSINGGAAGADVTFAIGSTFALTCDAVGNWYFLNQTGNASSASASLAVRAWVLWSGSGVTSSQNVTSMTHTATGKYTVVLSGGFTFVHGGALFTGTKASLAGYYGAANADIVGLNPTFTLNTYSAGALSDADGLGLLIIFGR